MMKNKIIDFFKKNDIFIIAIIYIITNKIFDSLMNSNELDVLASAKHFINPNWCYGDWYLSLGIGYRYFFNSIAGIMSLFMPLWIVAVIGRIIIYILFAYFIQKLFIIFKIKSYLIPIFLFFYFNFHSIVAEEWMIHSLETKSFSYFFLLMSLVFLIEKKYIKMFIFIGLSLSFHILIGLYGSICIFLCFLINYKYFRDDIKKILSYSYTFFISGSIGIFAIIKLLFENQNIDKIKGSLIYVIERVPHHTYPPAWDEKQWILKLIIFIIILLIIFIFFKEKEYKIISSFALSSIVFFTIGFLLYFFDKIYLLKYYWFRLGDVIIPFFSIFFIILIIEKSIFKICNFIRNINLKQYITRNIILFITLFSMIITFFTIKSFYVTINDFIYLGEYFYLRNTDRKLVESLLWIRENSNGKSIFLIKPEISSFYVVAERACFVSYKHSPQSEKDILEWKNRIDLCNDFYNMSEERIKNISKKYNLNYILTKSKNNYTFKKIYDNSIYAIYLL